MLVKALMLPVEKLTIASPDENLKSALQKIEDCDFLSIPVAEGDTFVGAVSKEKIFEEYFKGEYDNKESFLQETRVRSVFYGIIPRVDPTDPVERASRVLETFGIPFVAVVDEKDKFQGIVTHYAIFHTFGEIFGINEGRRIAVTAFDLPGQLAKLTEIVTRAGGDIISFAVLNPNVKLDVKEIVLRVRALNYDQLISRIREAGFRVE